MPKLKDEPTAFFNFCRNDFATKLRIPKAFAEEHGEFLHKKNVRLKTAESNRFWKVKMREMKDGGEICIADGWSEFVSDNSIVEMNILVLRIVSPATLHVTIFREDSCFHRPPSPPPAPIDQALQRTGWRFVKELKLYHFQSQRMEVPLSFAMNTGIGQKGQVRLRDCRGREWAVNVTNRSVKMYSFTAGWVRFLNGNRLKPPTVLLFAYVPDSDCLVNVVVMPSQAGTDLLRQAGFGGVLYSSFLL